MITFKASRGLTQMHVTEMLTLFEPANSLISSGLASLAVQKSLASKGDRALANRAPWLWLNLPREIRLTE